MNLIAILSTFLFSVIMLSAIASAQQPTISSTSTKQRIADRLKPQILTFSALIHNHEALDLTEQCHGWESAYEAHWSNDDECVTGFGKEIREIRSAYHRCLPLYHTLIDPKTSAKPWEAERSFLLSQDRISVRECERVHKLIKKQPLDFHDERVPDTSVRRI